MDFLNGMLRVASWSQVSILFNNPHVIFAIRTVLLMQMKQSYYGFAIKICDAVY